MHPLAALAVVAALVVATTATGIVWRAGQGRIRRTAPDAARLDGVDLAPGATLVLDPEGRIRARIAGAVRRLELAAELDRLAVPAAS